MQEEVNKVMEAAKVAQKSWAKTPLWKRAELLYKVAVILKEHEHPIAECLVKEIAKPAKEMAKPAKDALSEVSLIMILKKILKRRPFSLFFFKKNFYLRSFPGENGSVVVLGLIPPVFG